MRRPSLKTWRRLSQLAVILLFILVPILNKSRYSFLYGNLLAFQLWFIPLADPLAILQLSLKNLYVTFENSIGAFLPLLLAFLFGTVFCSWICPFGFLSEMSYHLSRKVLPRNYKGLTVQAKGFQLKLLIFIVGISFFLLFSTTPVLNQLSLPAWYTRFFQYLIGQSYASWSIVVIFLVLVLEFLAKKRLWCRYICPQSVLIILAKRLNRRRLMVQFYPEKCVCREESKGHCSNACTLGLHPKSVGTVAEYECTNCGDCVVACKKIGRSLRFRCIKKCHE